MNKSKRFWEIEGWQQEIDARFFKGVEEIKKSYADLESKKGELDIEEQLKLNIKVNEEAQLFLGAAFYCRVDVKNLENFREYLSTKVHYPYDLQMS